MGVCAAIRGPIKGNISDLIGGADDLSTDSLKMDNIILSERRVLSIPY